MSILGVNLGISLAPIKFVFFIVPKDENVIKEWQIAILRDSMKLKGGHAICEKYFDPEDILQERLAFAPMRFGKSKYVEHIIYFLN